MGHAINKETMREHPSVNVPDFDLTKFVVYNTRESHAEYLVAIAIPRKYRKAVGNSIVEMDDAEKAAVDIAELRALKDSEKARLEALVPPTRAEVDAAKTEIENATTTEQVRQVKVGSQSR